MTLFRREWAVTVGTLRVEAPLRVSFEIERTVRQQPNKATVKLWNLTREHQSQIELATFGQVVIEAGHEDNRGAEVLFRGELFRARSRQKPPGTKTEVQSVDAVTSVEARDGGRSYQRARISQSFGPGVSVSTVVRALVSAMGVGPGNSVQALSGVELLVGGTTYTEGTVLSGQASRETTRVLAGLGLRWSVQHGAVQIIRPGGALQTQAVRLSASTGLVGAPQPSSRGRVKVVALLTSDLWPGRHVVLDGERTQGVYTCESVKYTGDSHVQQWYAECELVPEAA